MRYDPEKHHRRSIRLKGYDYSQPGAYFVTICTLNRDCLFGEIRNDEMVLNMFGEIILEKWNNIPKHFQHTKLDAFGPMPNHVHGILFITGSYVGAKHSNTNIIRRFEDTSQNASHLQGRPHGTRPGSLSAIMQNYISITTRKINQIRNTPGEKLWQRNFYEHIIRNEKELNQIRDYIIHNPLKWEEDRNNPKNWKKEE